MEENVSVEAKKSGVGLYEPIEQWVAELQAAAEAVEESHPAPNRAWWRHPMSCACSKCVCECFRSAWNSKNNSLQKRVKQSEISRLISEKCVAWGVGWETVQKRAAAALGIPSTKLLGSFHELAANSSSKLEVWSSLRESIFRKQPALGCSLWGLWKSLVAEAWQGEPLSRQQRKAAVFELMREWVEGIWAEAATVRLLQEGLSSGLLAEAHQEWEGCSCSFAPSSWEWKDVDAMITSPSGEVVEKVSVKHGRSTLSAGCLRSWALSKPEPTLYAGYAGSEPPANASGLVLLSRAEVLGEGEW